jgi:hypothetical protein
MKSIILYAASLGVAFLLSVLPASALTAKQKMETCKFGADDQKLTGSARKKFISNCMANRDSPRGKPAPQGR